MEFGIRELVQFGTLLASLAGAFAVVKSQLSRVIQDIAEMEKTLNDINNTSLIFSGTLNSNSKAGTTNLGK